MYHVIAAPPPGAPFPGLYVTPDLFAAQMHALAAAGWHAVTQDQMRANWTRGVGLPKGKPIVVSFDNGYQSQYTKALPVMRSLGWAGVENIQLTGLPPSQGGFAAGQVKGLIAAGWELDTQGISHADLIRLSPADLHYQVAVSRAIIRKRYGVPVNWFCYPSGHYDPAVVAAVRAAGYVGSTTVVPGWAGPGRGPLPAGPSARARWDRAGGPPRPDRRGRVGRAACAVISLDDFVQRRHQITDKPVRRRWRPRCRVGASGDLQRGSAGRVEEVDLLRVEPQLRAAPCRIVLAASIRAIT